MHESKTALPLLMRQVGSYLRATLKAVVLEAIEETRAADKVDRALLTANELCEAISISRSKLDGLLAAGLPFVRVGSTRRFELQEVIEYLRSAREEEAAW